MSAMMSSWWSLAVVVCVFLTSSNVADAKPIVVIEEILSPDVQEDALPSVYVDTAEKDDGNARKALLDKPQGIDNTIFSPGQDRSWEDPNRIGAGKEDSWEDFNSLGGGFDVGNELYPPFDDDEDDVFGGQLEEQTTPPPPTPVRPHLSLLTLAEKIKKLERRMTARRADISRQVDKESRRRKELELVIRRQVSVIADGRHKQSEMGCSWGCVPVRSK
ncbi:hypothetical protein Bbelb_235940 [Branchiostoma belcheri]|nr:hypothetical protein Bbelb_235940 [Branchiostoma belcheri]